MDNPSSESSDLDLNGAATAFANMLDPQEQPADEEAPKVDTEVDPPKQSQAESEPEEEAEPNALEDSADAPITIEVDGKQITLTKAQLAEAYKSGLRQEDYTRKTMATAEERKAAAAEKAGALQERQAYAQNLAKMAAQLEGALEQQAKIDWDALLANDPVEFMRQKHLQDQRQAALQQNQQEQTQLRQRAQAEQAEALKGHLEEQQQLLVAKLPQWKDAATASKERDAIKDYLIREGFSPENIDGINDHKAVVLARKAMLYDQTMAKAAAAAKRVQNTPTKVEKPGVATERNPLDGRNAVMQRHAKSGTVESAAEVFASLL